MTDSPNLALAEEIERTIYRIEKLRSIRRGPTVELTNMEYDRIIAALRAQPSGDWIPVSERLPTVDDGIFAVSDADGQLGYGYVGKNQELILASEGTGPAIEWFPLPRTALSAAKERG